MSSINKVILVGNLGKDPELKTTPSGKSVTTLSLATNRSYKVDGEEKKQVEWHRVVVWGRQAESCVEYLSKGRQIYVEGRLSSRKYQKDGKDAWISEIIASTIQFLGGSGGSTQRSETFDVPVSDADIGD